jgi:integrase
MKPLTNENIRTLPAKTADTLYPDAGKHGVPGLFLRVREGGSRTFIAKWRQGSMQRRHNLGKVGVLSLDDARKAARELFVGIDKGVDPVAAKAKARVDGSKLFQTLAEDYLRHREKGMKPGSLDQIQRHLRLYWKPLHTLAVGKIDRALVASELRTMQDQRGPIAADRARSTLSAFYAWLIGEGQADINPVMGTNKSGQGRDRDRVLSEAELVRVWQAADPATDYGRIVRLLMLTAQRRDEIADLRHSEIVLLDVPGGALIDLPKERTKNSRPHMVPLSESAAAILRGIPQRGNRAHVFGEGEGGYSGFSRAKAAMDKRLAKDGAIEHWTLHDLRRSAATIMGDRLGVLPHVTEAILHHVSTAASGKAGVAGVYNRSTYLQEKRAALDAWAGYLGALVAAAEGANVVPLKRA